MPEADTATALLACVDAEQLRLRQMLAGKDDSVLASRPSSGKWSVAENVRHLLFAEQLHLGRFIPGERQWSALGLPPHNMQEQKRFRMLGEATWSVGQVLEAWQTMHASAAELARADTEEVRKVLQRHLKHLRSHITVIDRLLRAR